MYMPAFAQPKRLQRYFLLLLSLFFAFAAFSQPADNNNRHFLLRDEGLSQMSYIDMANPAANWYLPVPPGRDIQLVGNGRFLLGTGNGYEERDIRTGNKLFELTTFTGTISAHRLRNGHTLLAGLNWQGKQGIVLVEVDENGTVIRTIAYAGFTYVRLVRETPSGTYLVTSDETVFEGNANGEVIWRATITGKDKPHAWQALRQAISSSFRPMENY